MTDQTAQPSASGPNTPEGSTDRGTPVLRPHGTAQASERPSQYERSHPWAAKGYARTPKPRTDTDTERATDE